MIWVYWFAAVFLVSYVALKPGDQSFLGLLAIAAVAGYAWEVYKSMRDK